MNSLSEKDKEDILNRLKRIEGQVRGLQRMVKEEKYCVDILTQVSASRGALKKVAMKVLDRHINGCVKRAIINEESEEIISELMDVVSKFTD
ncbi:MAG: metal-sensitive transcriptional regulator [Halanaerobiales bacterium]